MAIGTYAELQAAVASWLHRTDLTSGIQDCIVLAEERFNRRLRTRHQETTLADTDIASYQITIPTNTIAVRRLWRVDGSLKRELMVAPLGIVNASQTGGLAYNYAWGATTWEFDGTGTVGGVLYRNIPTLSDSNTTNWLLTAYPSAYLYGTLAEAASHVRNTAGGIEWDAKTDSKIAEINRRENADAMSGPLRVRSSGAMIV